MRSRSHVNSFSGFLHPKTVEENQFGSRKTGLGAGRSRLWILIPKASEGMRKDLPNLKGFKEKMRIVIRTAGKVSIGRRYLLTFCKDSQDSEINS